MRFKLWCTYSWLGLGARVPSGQDRHRGAHLSGASPFGTFLEISPQCPSCRLIYFFPSVITEIQWDAVVDPVHEMTIDILQVHLGTLRTYNP